MDSYLTLSTPGEGLLTEKRSKFYSYAFPVESEEDVKQYVAALRKKFYDARHICFAYILGSDGSVFRSNDDGEPSGTAGKPILGQIRSAGLTNTLVIVIRYFGGIKLGTGGLIQAYKTSAAQSIATAEKKEKWIMERFVIEVPYTEADVAMRFVKEGGAKIEYRDFTPTTTLLSIAVKRSLYSILKERLSKILTLKFLDNNKET